MRVQLPEGWAWTTLGEVVSPSSEKVEPQDWPDVRYISLEHMESGTHRILGHGVGADVGSTKARFHSGDVLYGRLRPYLNKVFIPDFDGMCSTDILVFPPSGAVDNRFLMYLLSLPEVVEFATRNASGINLPRISFEKLGEMEVALPPLPEQRRVAARIEELLSRTSRSRESLEAVPALVDRFRQSVLASAFRGDLTADWRAGHPDVEPASALLQRIRAERRRQWEEAEFAKMRAKGKAPKDNRWKEKYQEPEPVDAPGLPQLPEGWVWTRLDSLVSAQRGITYGIVQTGQEHPNGVPTVRCGDIKEFSIDWTQLKRVAPTIEAQNARTRLEGGEVLIAIRGTVGATAVVSGEMRGINISREVAMIPGLPGVDPYFLMYLLKSPQTASRILGQVKGVAQAGINLSDLRALVLPLPPLAEQHLIVEQVNHALGRVANVTGAAGESIRSADLVDRAILAKAFRGELVAQDPTDEPASVLLERIRQQRANKSGGRRRKRGEPGN